MKALRQQVVALLKKDLTREWRTREITTTTLSFSILLVVVFTFAFYTSDEQAASLLPGILMTSIIFTGTLALGRTFFQEKESGCLRAVALIPGSGTSLYWAKFLINLFYLLLFELLLVPITVLAFGVSVGPVWPQFLAVIFGVTVGFAAHGTLVGAMLVHSHLRDVMLPILLYPLAIPLFLAGVKVTSDLLTTGDPTASLASIRTIFALSVVFIAVSSMLFRFVLEAIE